MTYSISKEFTFSAAHYLQGLPPSHPCARLHGHNYTVKVEIMAESVDKVGFVLDYNHLNQIRDYLDNTFDHQCINDVLEINPTAENLAFHIWHWINGSSIGSVLGQKFDSHGMIVYVSETPKTWASFDGREDA